MTTIVAFEILRRRDVADGREFGAAGAYQRIDARAHLRIDPRAPEQAGIVDLDKAPRDAEGRVSVVTDVQLLQPVDPNKSNRRLFVELVNRGNKRSLQFFNDAPGNNDPISDADMGNGYLLRRGYTVCWIGWQGDILPGDGRLQLDVPVANDGDRPLSGKVRSEFIVSSPGIYSMPLSGWVSTRSHPAASLDTTQATLVRRRYPYDTPQMIASNAWQFARVEGGAGLDNQGSERSVIASDLNIYLPAGFEPGWIYELVYEGRDPLVLGLGHTAVRDVTSFLRNADVDANGTANPCRRAGSGIDKVYGWGRSQTGRYLRDFVYHGFNADHAGRRVFDGVLPHVSGGGLMWMNHRFANVVRPAGQDYEDHFNPADRFPFSYAHSTDHTSGISDAILKRPATDPLIIHTQTATEYWQRHGSLVHTDTQGRDLEQPANVRVYLWSSSQHFADPLLKGPAKGVCREDLNVVWTSMLFRGVLDAMDAWATSAIAPPPSRIPRRRDLTLLKGAEWHAQFPAIPGLQRPRGPSPLPHLDWGPKFAAGIVDEPPRLVSLDRYVVQVPSTDADGNDRSGVRAPMVEAPLATYTGWNIRARGQGAGAMHEFTGSTVPFAETDVERQQTGDPRPSITARYGNAVGYVDAIRRAAEALVADRLMIAEDVERCVAAARRWHAPRHKVSLP